MLQKIFAKIGLGLGAFWQWFKPKYGKFHHFRKRIWKRYHIHKIFILICGIFILVLSTYLTFKAQTADISSIKADMLQPTEIFDEKGQKAGILKKQKGTFVESNQISQNVKDAVVSTEDKRFYQHHGFDVRGMGRAVVSLVINKGQIAGGGSTITQQLAKNTRLTPKQTFSRKAEELFLAIKIEKNYSKEDILTMYLNKAYFGNGVWGVEDAAHKYFGKSASELTVPESANLAAILKSPSYYNPKDSLEHATQRRNLIIDLMADNQKITKEQANQFKQAPTNLVDNYEETNDYRYPYYFDAVIDEAENKYGIKEDDLLTKGYKVYTSLNTDYQQKMEETYKNDSLFPGNAADGTLVQSGSVAMNPKTGGVSAIVGGRGEHVFRGFNRGTQIKVQPGSTMKPIAVYAPALEAGYHYDTILKDQKFSYKQKNGKVYTPENFTHTYQGEVPMYQALAQSLNAPAVWLLDKIGLSKGFKSAEKFGIPVSKDEVGLSLALGGFKSGVSPMKMANAYAVFANDGKKPTGHFITKIVDASGAVIVNNQDPDTKNVISKEVATEMTSMMQGVYNQGTGANAKPEGYTIAGKTGSTEYGTDGVGTRDQWMIGYTPDIVVATWVGFDKVDDQHNLAGTSGAVIAPLFKTEMENILPHTPQTAFSAKDAQSLVNEKKEDKDWFDNLKDGAEQWGGKFKDGANYIKGEADKWADNIKGWFGQ